MTHVIGIHCVIIGHIVLFAELDDQLETDAWCWILRRPHHHRLRGNRIDGQWSWCRHDVRIIQVPDRGIGIEIDGQSAGHDQERHRIQQDLTQSKLKPAPRHVRIRILAPIHDLWADYRDELALLVQRKQHCVL